MRLPASLDALHEREFRLLFIGQAVSLLGDGMVSVAMAFAVLDLTGSASDLGLVLAAKTVPMVAFLLIGGVFADRLPRRAVMLTADVVRLVSQGAMAGLLVTGHARIWELAVLQAVHGSATAFFNPASTGLLPALVSSERLQQANALRGLTRSLGSIVGPALAGVLVATVGPGWALGIDSLSFAVSAGFLAKLSLPAHQKLPPSSFLRDLHDGWREFKQRTWVWSIVLFAALGNALTSIWVVLGALIAKQSLGGASAWALIVASLGVGSLLSGLVALRIKPRRPLLVGAISILAFAGPPLALAAGLPLGVIAGLAVLSGAGAMLFGSLWDTALQQHIPRASLSRVSAYDWFGSLAFQPIGLAVAGPIAAVAGTHRTLWVAGALLAASSVILLSIPDVRRLERTPDGQVAGTPEGTNGPAR